MSNFTLGTFYTPKARTELKLFYLNGDGGFTITNNRTGKVLVRGRVPDGGTDVATFYREVRKAVRTRRIARAGTFYDYYGDVYSDEKLTKAGLAAAITRAFNPPARIREMDTRLFTADVRA